MTLPDAIEARGCTCRKCGLRNSIIHLNSCPVQIAADVRSGALGEDMEPEEPMVYRARGDEKELWCVMAHRAGLWTPMSPKHFPFPGNYDEVVERVRIKLATDAALRARWKDHYFTGARVDGQVMA